MWCWHKWKGWVFDGHESITIINIFGRLKLDNGYVGIRRYKTYKNSCSKCSKIKIKYRKLF